MSFEKCVERNHEAILDYWYYSPVDKIELPQWVVSSIETKDDDLILEFKDAESVVVSFGQTVVYDETNNKATVLEMEEFMDSYHRVEE